MQNITVKRIVNAPAADVWTAWDDFGNIERFNPGISGSRLLGSSTAATGKGAKRECQLKDGKNWVRERIVDYTPGERMEIEVYEGSLPLKSMRATIEVRRVSDEQSEVSFMAEFEPKFGIVGKLMAPMMKRQFRGMLRSLLDGNAAYVEKGELVPQAA